MSTRNFAHTIRRPLFLFFTLIALGLLAIVAPDSSSVTRAATVLPGGQSHANPPGTGGSKGVPSTADAFAYLSPCNIVVSQGVTFTLDLLINAGTNQVVGQ